MVKALVFGAEIHQRLCVRIAPWSIDFWTLDAFQSLGHARRREVIFFGILEIGNYSGMDYWYRHDLKAVDADEVQEFKTSRTCKNNIEMVNILQR